MRICKCGGIVGQHQLTNNREAWSCRSCGRYEIFDVIKELNGSKQWTTLKDSGTLGLNHLEKAANQHAK